MLDQAEVLYLVCPLLLPCALALFLAGVCYPSKTLVLYKEGCTQITTPLSLSAGAAVALATVVGGGGFRCAIAFSLFWGRGQPAEGNWMRSWRSELIRLIWTGPPLMINVLQSKKGVICPYWFCWPLQILFFCLFPCALLTTLSGLIPGILLCFVEHQNRKKIIPVFSK